MVIFRSTESIKYINEPRPDTASLSLNVNWACLDHIAHGQSDRCVLIVHEL